MNYKYLNFKCNELIKLQIYKLIIMSYIMYAYFHFFLIGTVFLASRTAYKVRHDLKLLFNKILVNTGISLQSFKRNNISIATSNFTMTMCYLQNPCKIPQIDVVLKTFIYTNKRQLHKERDLSNHFLYLLCLT